MRLKTEESRRGGGQRGVRKPRNRRRTPGEEPREMCFNFSSFLISECLGSTLLHGWDIYIRLLLALLLDWLRLVVTIAAHLPRLRGVPRSGPHQRRETPHPLVTRFHPPPRILRCLEQGSLFFRTIPSSVFPVRTHLPFRLDALFYFALFEIFLQVPAPACRSPLLEHPICYS